MYKFCSVEVEKGNEDFGVEDLQFPRELWASQARGSSYPGPDGFKLR